MSASWARCSCQRRSGNALLTHSGPMWLPSGRQVVNPSSLIYGPKAAPSDLDLLECYVAFPFCLLL